MPATVVVGAQWGDEGKGKVVDLLSPHADVVVRYAGGANAGHTLVVEGKKIVLHLIPSGILHEGCHCVVGQGTVVDPGTLIEELEALEKNNVSVAGRLTVSERAHVVLPHHKLVDALRESGAKKIGTTKRGIGPTYEDKVGRRGIRVGDLLKPHLRERVEANMARWAPIAEGFGGTLPTVDETMATLRQWASRLRPFIGNGGQLAYAALQDGKNVLLEGAQGVMLDVDQGTYPFVTSSNAVAGGACTGSGIGPAAINRCTGIAKAYATRVGEGPFPSELDDEIGERIRQAGAEFGATTGRPRRCGWIDLPALRLAVRASSLESIALTKLDVLSGLEKVAIATHYEIDGERFETPPFDAYADATPVYEWMEGWSEDIRHCRSHDELPEAALRYLRRLEALLACPISIVSVGPDREETFGQTNPFS